MTPVNLISTSGSVSSVANELVKLLLQARHWDRDTPKECVLSVPFNVSSRTIQMPSFVLSVLIGWLLFNAPNHFNAVDHC